MKDYDNPPDIGTISLSNQMENEGIASMLCKCSCDPVALIISIE